MVKRVDQMKDNQIIGGRVRKGKIVKICCIGAGYRASKNGLDDVVKQYRGKNLFFSTDVKKHVHEADTVFVSINKLTKTMSRSWKNRRFDVLGECGSGGCRCVLVVDVKECSLYFLLLVVMSF
ncbi:UDP-glucose 6-dehydrogenase, putative [Medicago truncatula]|uniref:UDP-glucose 6-dehydrogenase, putative n=1 Tax=Medicago truncatula TaxID=3880 RepID=G7KMB8_MEDTR|nr:UDP-glucose 6-dehydrogenase, putative [Medicago truncatula]